MRKAPSRRRRLAEVLSIVPRLYVYPATLSPLSVPALDGANPPPPPEREVHAAPRCTFLVTSPRRAAPRRAVPSPRSAAQCRAAPRPRPTGGRVADEKERRCPSLSNYTCPSPAITSRISRSCPRRLCIILFRCGIAPCPRDLFVLRLGDFCCDSPSFPRTLFIMLVHVLVYALISST